MKFTTKILLMPLLALLALGVIFASLFWAGSQALVLFDLIETEQVRALEISHEMEMLAVEVRQHLADAATVGDFDRITEADSLANRFRQTLSAYSMIPSVETNDIGRLRRDFTTYFDHARATSVAMLDGELDEELILAAGTMNQQFETLLATLNETTRHRQNEIAAAFNNARARIQTSGKAISLTILLLFLVLLVVSVGAIVSVLRPLRRLMKATEAITQGDLEAPIDYECNDEMGRLADSFRHMQASLIADIRRREEMERALRESEERYRSVFVNSTLGIFRSEPDGNVITANPAAAQICGYPSPEEAIAAVSDLAEQVYADPNDRVWILQALELNGEVSGELEMKRPDGTRFTAQLNLWTVTDKNGALRFIEGLIEDITEKRSMQEALQHSEERLQLAIDAANDGLFDYDIEDDFLYMSPRYQRMLGYEPGELKPELATVFELMHPDDRHDPDEYRRFFEGGEPYDEEARFQHKDGHFIWIHTRAKVVEWDNEGNPLRFVGTNVDITKRKTAEAELKKAQKELLNAAHTAGMAEIATSVLHNVGNALNGALTSTTMMDKTLKNTRVGHLEKLATLVKQHEGDFVDFVANTDQGRKLPIFFQQLSDVIRSEHRKLTEELRSLVKSHEHIRQIIALQQQYAGSPGYREEVDPEELVRDAVQLFGASFARHHIHFRIERPDTLVPILVEKHKVLQILINLLKNARDAVREADRPDRQILVNIRPDDSERITFEVSDNGVGISRDHLDKVFNYGFTTKHDGHGYGLHGCANAAAEMDGALDVHSDGPGAGATFTLTLPLSETEKQDRVPTANHG